MAKKDTKKIFRKTIKAARFYSRTRTHVTHMNSDEGNTKKPRLRSWFFTYNNPEISATQLTQLLTSAGDVNKFAFQLEVGESGTPHFQGVCCWRNQIQFSTLKHLDTNIHWEPCKNIRAALQYCTKSDTRKDGPWVLGWHYEPPRTWAIPTPHLWQSQVLERIRSGQGDRRICWIADPTGGWGKTTLAKHICGDLGGLLVTGRASDIKYAIAQRLRRGRMGTCVFHFTRTQEEYVSYQAIEEVKDGIFFSAKYEAGMCIFESPFILVLANFHPDRSKLTGDRWDVNVIGADGGLWVSL